MRAYSPGGTLNAFATVPGLPPTPSVHRLLCGLPGYLNLFAPRTFAPQRQYMARYLPSPSVFFQISTDFTPTPGIPISPPVLKLSSFQRQTGLSPEFLHQTCQAACVPFTPNNSEQRSPPTCYRGCWHVVSRGFLQGYRHYLPQGQKFTTQRPSSFTRRCCIRVSPIVQYSPLLPPVGVWAVSQSQCGRPPSQAGYPSSPWWAFTPPTS